MSWLLAGCSGDGNGVGDGDAERTTKPSGQGESATTARTATEANQEPPTDTETESSTHPEPTGGTVNSASLAGPHPSFGVDGGNTHAGSGAGPQANLVEEAWRREFPNTPSPPVIGEDTVYATADGTAYALSLVDGSTVWEAADARGVPVVADGAVYLGGGGTSAHSRADGSLRWQVGVPMGTLTLAEATLYGTNGGTLTALEAPTGEVRWQTSFESRFAEFVGHPAVGDGMVVIAATDIGSGSVPGVLGFDAETGAEEWRETFDTGVPRPVATRDGTCYVAIGSTVHTFATGDGASQWSYDAGVRVTTPPTVSDLEVLVGTEDGTLHNLDPDSGEGIDFQVSDSRLVGLTDGGGGLYFGQDRSHGDGGQIDGWSIQVVGTVASAPALAAETYVVSSSGTGGGFVSAVVAEE